jgi:diacylglycerol O-acyltransferase / wax synthase
MKQLSGADAMFLQLEHGNNFMHVASLAIYDPSSAPDGKVRFKDVLRHFAARVEEFPQFRRRLVRVPLSLDRPYWVEDSGIDVEFHVRHIALPHPGDWRQLCIQVARLHSRPLDRSKPLWEAYIIEGLHNVPGVPAGSFALYTKMHHAIIDGESGTELLKALHSMTPEPIDENDAPLGGFTADREPRLPELYSRALIQNIERLPSLARFSLSTAKRVASLGLEAVGNVSDLGASLLPQLRTLLSGDLSPLLAKLPPQTRFSGDVSAHRVFEAIGLPLADFKTIRRQVGGVTLNDLFLAIVGGTLNKYLGGKRELPETSMVAGVPMTLRGEEKGGDRGNQVGFTFMPVYSEVADPLLRLRAIADSAQASKRMTDAVGKELARDLLEYLPGPIGEALVRNVKLPGIGVIVSNVRGPDVPLYMAGAQLVNYSPISIALDGIGLNVTGFSYNGTMWVCAVSCREMMPDPAHFADCMRASFAELKEAAARYAAVTEEPLLGEDDLPPAARPGTRPAVVRKPAAPRSKKSAAKPRARAGVRKTGRTRRKPAAAAPGTAQG